MHATFSLFKRTGSYFCHSMKTMKSLSYNSIIFVPQRRVTYIIWISNIYSWHKSIIILEQNIFPDIWESFWSLSKSLLCPLLVLCNNIFLKVIFKEWQRGWWIDPGLLSFPIRFLSLSHMKEMQREIAFSFV